MDTKMLIAFLLRPNSIYRLYLQVWLKTEVLLENLLEIEILGTYFRNTESEIPGGGGQQYE